MCVCVWRGGVCGGGAGGRRGGKYLTACCEPDGGFVCCVCLCVPLVVLGLPPVVSMGIATVGSF